MEEHNNINIKNNINKKNLNNSVENKDIKNYNDNINNSYINKTISQQTISNDISINNNNNNKNNISIDISSLLSKLTELKLSHKYEDALKLIEKDLKQTQENSLFFSEYYYKISLEINEICSLQADDHFLEGNYIEGINILTENINLFSNYKEILCISYINLGNYYKKLNLYEQAIKYYDESLKICNLIKNKKLIAEIHINYGVILINLNKNKLALEQILYGIILFQEFLIENENNQDQNDFNEIYNNLYDSYMLLGFVQSKLENYLEKILYCNLGEKILKEKISNRNVDKLNENQQTYFMLKTLFENLNENKNIIDIKEKNATLYIKNRIKVLMNEIEKKNIKTFITEGKEEDYYLPIQEGEKKLGRFQMMIQKLNNTYK